MPAAAFLATIQSPVALRPIAEAPARRLAAPITSVASTSPSLLAILVSSMRRWVRSTGTPPAAAEARPVVSSVHGLRTTAEPHGHSWRALPVVHSHRAPAPALALVLPAVAT